MRVRGILWCHAGVNSNSHFKVRIEAQSSVALNYRSVSAPILFVAELLHPVHVLAVAAVK
jgi:hypothetical protein